MSQPLQDAELASIPARREALQAAKMAPRDAELIEVSPGRWRDPALCSQQDLEAAQAA